MQSEDMSKQLMPPSLVFPGKKPSWLKREVLNSGIFSTGIEGSDPVIAGGRRRNLFKEAADFYMSYPQRLANINKLGIRWLRFGPPYSQTHCGPDCYDFLFVDQVLDSCRNLGLTVIADLLHFGLPDWLHAKNPDLLYFQNPDFPYYFAEYAKAFAKRYPHIVYYTVVNEPFITALFSAKYGIWNEQIAGPGEDDQAFVRAVCSIAKAFILGRRAIEQAWEEECRPGQPVFVQNDSFEKAYASVRSKRHREVALYNFRRFAALDLMFGLHDDRMYYYLITQNMPERDYGWFMEHGTRNCCMLGIDHYPTCIHTYYPTQVKHHKPEQTYELYGLVKEYWDRYHVPMLHTEVNAWTEDGVDICWQTYAAICQLRLEGYPVLGMGWYGDEHQVGWRRALMKDEIDPVGLYHKGRLQPVGEFFKDLILRGLPPVRGWERT